MPTTLPTPRPNQFPKVFVGTPYKGKILDALLPVLEDLPFQISMARDSIQNKQQLKICKDLIKWSDFCIFDVSGWNVNVMLEMGLAHGMNSKYFIICNTDYSKKVPSNIQGVQRIEYNSYHRTNTEGLWYLIMSLIGIQNSLIEGYWRRFRNNPAGIKQRIYASRILSRFRYSNYIPLGELRPISRGLRLDAKSIDKTVATLTELNLVERTNRSVRLNRRLFPPAYRAD